jgi:hypothetical protein
MIALATKLATDETRIKHGLDFLNAANHKVTKATKEKGRAECRIGFTS